MIGTKSNVSIPTGLNLSEVTNPVAEVWSFVFRNNEKKAIYLNIECPWRLVQKKAFISAGYDNGKKFGLPQKFDAHKELITALDDQTLKSVNVLKYGDLALSFTNNYILETFTYSGGYESWTLKTPKEMLVCMGSGEVTIFKQP